MYMNLSIVTAFVQTPTADGLRFGASVVVAGLILVPFSIMSLLASRLLPWLSARVGGARSCRWRLTVVAPRGAFFALVHGASGRRS